MTSVWEKLLHEKEVKTLVNLGAALLHTALSDTLTNGEYPQGMGSAFAALRMQGYLKDFSMAKFGWWPLASRCPDRSVN